MGFSCGSADKESTCNAGDLSLIPSLGRSLGEGKGYPLQYSCLENSMDYMGLKSQTNEKNVSWDESLHTTQFPGLPAWKTRYRVLRDTQVGPDVWAESGVTMKP